MSTRHARLLVSALAVAMAACGIGQCRRPIVTERSERAPSPTPTSTAVQDIYDVPHFAPLETGCLLDRP